MVDRLAPQKFHPLFKAALDRQVQWLRGDPAGALDGIEADAETRKLGPHEVLLRGLLLYEAGEWENARPHLKVAATKGVLDDRLVLARAGVMMKRGEHGKARTLLKKSVKEKMNQWRAWLLLGECEVELKNLKGARTAYLSVTRLAPNFEPGWTHAAGVLVDLGEREKAAETLRRIVKLQPGFISAQLGLVQILQDLGEYQEARDRLKVVGKWAIEPTILLQVAEYMMELHEYVDVVHILNRAQKQAEHNPRLWFLRGELARAAGPEGKANAIQHYREALLRDGDFTVARERLDELLKG